tara:strand:+ start:210 stop:404 length:195 start_codon:yes stop_codon:yes gene_type:complete
MNKPIIKTVNNITIVKVGNDSHVFSRKVAFANIRSELTEALARADQRGAGAKATVRSLTRMLAA